MHVTWCYFRLVNEGLKDDEEDDDDDDDANLIEVRCLVCHWCY